MPAAPIMGVENEFEFYYDGKCVSFQRHFGKLYQNSNQPYFRKSELCIRTGHGSSIYVDGNEPEICTPPVLITKGGFTELTDSLYQSRKILLDMVKQNSRNDISGYSMHVNFSQKSFTVDMDKYMSIMGVPLALFGLNHLSYAINLRIKVNGRLELLTDYIEDLDQCRALFVLYAASLLGFERYKSLAETKIPSNGTKIANPVKDGRITKIRIKTPVSSKLWEDPWSRSGIMAQDYLEIIYRHVKPYVDAIATRHERKNLEDFIFGRKALEVDKYSKYAFTHIFKDNEGLGVKHHPLLVVNPEDYRADKPAPPLGRFLGRFVNKNTRNHSAYPKKIWAIDWETVRFDTVHGIESTLKGFKTFARIEEALSKIPIDSWPEAMYISGKLFGSRSKTVPRKKFISYVENSSLSDTEKDMMRKDGRLTRLGNLLYRMQAEKYPKIISPKNPDSAPANIDSLIDKEVEYVPSMDKSTPEEKRLVAEYFRGKLEEINQYKEVFWKRLKEAKSKNQGKYILTRDEWKYLLIGISGGAILTALTLGYSLATHKTPQMSPPHKINSTLQITPSTDMMRIAQRGEK